MDLLSYLEDINMVIYKNDYKREEDETLWELHEARNQLMKEIKNKSIDEINKSALDKLEKWNEGRKKVHV